MGVTHHGRTQRLDLADPTLREWTCTVLASDPETGIVLDRSAFYPGGGGQPPDHGVLLWGGVQTRIAGTRKGSRDIAGSSSPAGGDIAGSSSPAGGDLYLIPEPGDPLPPAGTVVSGAVADDRRTMLMRTHSGLHVLCGVVFRDFGALVTGGNMDAVASSGSTLIGEARMDFNLPDVPPDFKTRLEELVNAEIVADRRVAVTVLPRDEALALPDIIRTQSNLIPADEQEIRIVDIVGLDVQADGGTHVASTKHIGKLAVVKVESKGKANRRVRVRILD